ncbi:MAG: Fe-S cluster assembly protein SufB [Candidatus Woesebacteria bacterium]
MSRFANKHTTQFDDSVVDSTYTAGFSYPTDKYSFISKPGLSKRVVEELSHIKEEPEWMLEIRLKALEIFEGMQTPTWGGVLSEIDYDKIHYYLKPTDKSVESWNDVPADVKATFDKLGIPQAERDVLAGVKAQYDSEVVYGSLQNIWEEQGVIFLSMDEGLKQYPDLIKEYFGKNIPSGDNKFAALNTAVWSGGSFVYVPKGLDVKMPLQAYFRINSPNAGQFERTLIIVDEGASVHYVEGCFTAGTRIQTDMGEAAIESIEKGDLVLTHEGRYKEVYYTQVRPYSGDLYTIELVGSPKEKIETTQEHPFLIVKRQRKNERNSKWIPSWTETKNISKYDYACIPIDREIFKNKTVRFPVLRGAGRHGPFLEEVSIPSTEDFFRLVGYYLAEGSISSGHYLNFSFNSNEREYIDDVKKLIRIVFDENRISEQTHKTNHGTSVVVSSTRLCRLFKQFGTKCDEKKIPLWMMKESLEKQKQLLLGWYRGDGNYYKKTHKHGLKEVFRLCTTSKTLASQARQILLRLNIASSLNWQSRSYEGRKTMYVCVIGGQYLSDFAKIAEEKVEDRLHNKKRATFYHIDEKYMYVPIRSIERKTVKNLPVYNFSVRDDESYVAGGVAVHNCTAPAFSSGSLHSAVVEIFVKKGARCQYTTIQNWYKNVYNLVTKRARVEEEATMVWTDFNMGSKLTMKYPSFLLVGKGAKGETLSMALAGAGQHQDTGSKAMHLAPYTSSTIISKSISKDGGRTSYRGMVMVSPQAHHSKNTVVCDAMLLDGKSRSDTYPTDRIMNDQVEIQHEATVSRIGDEQLFYLMSRGVTEEDSRKMIVNGFVNDLVKKLPLEYAIEMNRLIDHEMEGSVG